MEAGPYGAHIGPTVLDVQYMHPGTWAHVAFEVLPSQAVLVALPHTKGAVAVEEQWSPSEPGLGDGFSHH